MNGNLFTSDPLKVTHLAGCLPIDFTSVLEKYKIDSTGTPGQAVWPVTIHMSVNRPVKPMFVYRLPDDSSMCYRFIFKSKQLGNGKRWRVLCAGCFSLYTDHLYQGGSSFACGLYLYADGRQLLSDPLVGHNAECRPFKLMDVLKRFPQVTTIVADRIINNEDISQFLPPHGLPFAVCKSVEVGKRFPFQMVQNNRFKRLSIIYFLPDEPHLCYTFTVQPASARGLMRDRTKVVNVRCVGCVNFYKMKSSTKSSFDDPSFRHKQVMGKNFLVNPAVGHAEGCKAKSTAKTMEKYTIVDDFGDYLERNPSESEQPAGEMADQTGSDGERDEEGGEGVEEGEEPVEMGETADDERNEQSPVEMEVIHVSSHSGESTESPEVKLSDEESIEVRVSSTSPAVNKTTSVHLYFQDVQMSSEGSQLTSSDEVKDEDVIIGYLRPPTVSNVTSESCPVEGQLTEKTYNDTGVKSKRKRKFKQSFDPCMFGHDDVIVTQRGSQLEIRFEKQLSSDKDESTESHEVKLTDEVSEEVWVSSTPPAVNKTTSGNDWNSLADAQSEDSDERSGFDGTGGEVGAGETMEIGEMADEERNGQSLAASQLLSQGSQLTTSGVLKDGDVLIVYSGPPPVNDATSESCPVESQLTETSTSNETGVKSKRKRKFKQAFDPCLFGHDDVIVAQRGSQLEIRFEKQTAPSSVKMRLSYDLVLPPDIDLDSMRWKWKEGGNLVVRAEYKQVL